MTGPEHFRRAELMLAEGARGSIRESYLLAAAQAHATLALAAATALSRPAEGLPSADWKAWLSAAGVSAT